MLPTLMMMWSLSVIGETIVEPTFYNNLTINHLISSGQYNVIDDRSGSLGVTLQGTDPSGCIMNLVELFSWTIIV